MKAIEILKNNETLFLVDSISGKARNLAEEINSLFNQINENITKVEEFKNNQLNGDYNRKIYMAKSLDRFFGPNKFLKLDAVIAGYAKEDKEVIDYYYALKNKLLNSLKALIKESNKSAVVCKYDLFENSLNPCQDGHEVLILGGRNVEILNYIITSLDNDLNTIGNFNNVHARNLDFDKTTLLANVDMCNQRANSLLSGKQNRLTKIVTAISKLKEVSHRVVAFYTFKEDLLFVGCQEKGVNAYENALSKEYIPLKKLIEKELQLELKDISNIHSNGQVSAIVEDEAATSSETIESSEETNTPEIVENGSTSVEETTDAPTNNEDVSSTPEEAPPTPTIPTFNFNLSGFTSNNTLTEEQSSSQEPISTQETTSVEEEQSPIEEDSQITDNAVKTPSNAEEPIVEETPTEEESVENNSTEEEAIEESPEESSDNNTEIEDEESSDPTEAPAKKGPNIAELNKLMQGFKRDK